ncbi:hypothetical protein B0T18DRAFT_427193 [Schizothecium vesticola]|uniref:Uncharacterized protein n=1 Tax=Schizothecium vesticola TaxID=314040 RepID=A0AA40F108_9PEZI|nr:hypothetical protein B0T18DRAFT_427193 [Schizothecium vesticola]
MGNTWSSPALPVGAQFASNDMNLSSDASHSTCHVFGDPGLYGAGVRTGYYLQYAAAVLTVLYLPLADQQLWLLSFLPLAAASLVGLSLNAAEGELVILDWAIVFGLVFWSIAFLAWPVFRGASRTGSLEIISDPKQLRQDLEKDGGRTVTDQEAEWHARYVAVIRAATADEQRRGSRNHGHEDAGELSRLETALRDYVTSFASARFSPASVGASSYVLDLYADSQLPDLAARMLSDNAQLESFRDGHTEALRRANVPFNQAQSTTQTLGRLAIEGPRLGDASYRRSPRSLLTAGSPRPIAGGLGLILYSGFSAFTVWLLFLGADHGSRPPCDIRFLFILVPTSAYNPRAMTALRVLASLWLALAAVPALVAGSALVVTGTMAWWDQGTPTYPTAAPTNPTGRYDAEKGKDKEIDIPSPASLTRASRTSELLYEMDELPLHHRSASSPTVTSASSPRDTRISSYHSGSVFTKDTIEPMLGVSSSSAAGGMDIRGGLGGSGSRRGSWAGRSKPAGARVRWQWGMLLLVPLVHTIVVVEVTIRINGVDMRRRGMTTMGELLAFFLGLGVFKRGQYSNSDISSSKAT